MHCENEYESNALTVEEALDNILQKTHHVASTEKVDLRHALNRVSAIDHISRINVPPHRNSAMDGYAFIHNGDISAHKPLTIIGESLAGHPYNGPNIKQGECIRVMTGALMPQHTNTVIMQEEVTTQHKLAYFQTTTKLGQHVRQAGEDSSAGNICLPQGMRINSAHMGFLHACGIPQVTVYRRPQVAFFTTGDELKDVQEDLAEGEIYDSNKLSLLGMLQEAHCEVISLGIVADNKTALEKVFQHATNAYDCVISTGGVSVGAADHIKTILAQCGNTHFWRIAMKPGRPLTFGSLQNSLFFGLPGNPVSVMATFYLFVIPALRRLSGEKKVLPQRLRARCSESIRKRPGRTDYQRGILQFNEHTQQLEVTLAGKQQSHLLSGMACANCFIELARETGNVPENTYVTVIPFSGLLS